MIIMPAFRPKTCEECPLCGTRPVEDLEPGTKWTHICVKDERIMSGRGIKQPNARNRCTLKQYEYFYFSQTAKGRYAITPSRMKRYGIQQTKLCFAP